MRRRGESEWDGGEGGGCSLDVITRSASLFMCVSCCDPLQMAISAPTVSIRTYVYLCNLRSRVGSGK